MKSASGLQPSGCRNVSLSSKVKHIYRSVSSPSPVAAKQRQNVAIFLLTASNKHIGLKVNRTLIGKLTGQHDADEAELTELLHKSCQSCDTLVFLISLLKVGFYQYSFHFPSQTLI